MKYLSLVAHTLLQIIAVIPRLRPKLVSRYRRTWNLYHWCAAGCEAGGGAALFSRHGCLDLRCCRLHAATRAPACAQPSHPAFLSCPSRWQGRAAVVLAVANIY